MVQFTLVVDDFGVKYVGKENAEHLIRTIRKARYTFLEDRAGVLYHDIMLNWYYKEGHVEVLMPHYIEWVLLRFKHEIPK